MWPVAKSRKKSEETCQSRERNNYGKQFVNEPFHPAWECCRHCYIQYIAFDPHPPAPWNFAHKFSPFFLFWQTHTSTIIVVVSGSLNVLCRFLSLVMKEIAEERGYLPGRPRDCVYYRDIHPILSSAVHHAWLSKDSFAGKSTNCCVVPCGTTVTTLTTAHGRCCSFRSSKRISNAGNSIFRSISRPF